MLRISVVSFGSAPESRALREFNMGWVVKAARGLHRLAARLYKAERANVAIIYALSLIPLLVAAGAAVDLSRALVVRARLSQALDAAGLAVGATTNLTQQQMQDLATKYFNANYPSTKLGVPGAITVSQTGQVIDLTATASLSTTLMYLVGINTLNVGVSSEITRSSNNIEVGLALDITGSMSGSSVASLITSANSLVDIVVQDAQTPTYSKVAIVPWANAVNVSSTYASQVRGSITGSTSITGAAWAAGAGKTITGATKANPVVITSAAHGFSAGDTVYIASVGGMTQLNTKHYTITSVTTNTFALSGVNGTGYNTFTSGGTVTKCKVANCEVVVTSASHGLANNDYVYITGVNGMTQINNSSGSPTWQVDNVTSTTFGLATSTGPSYSAYTSGGSAYCVKLGCQYYRFTSASGSVKVFAISNCVSERSGADAFTDTAPSTTPLGYDYAATVAPPAITAASSANPCVGYTIQPLSSDKTSLHTLINSLTSGGSTGGQIGVAWAWYLISPNFGYLFPTASQPAAYNAPNTVKAVVLETDGQFNSPYCNGVIAKDATSGSGSSADHNNCNSPNSDSYTQAKAVCDAMKLKGVIVYTVGFNLQSDTNAQDLMSYCATDSSHAFLANDGSDLQADFQTIAQSITNLRVSR
jgi:Flp pilus assembly protein TadG